MDEQLRTAITDVALGREPDMSTEELVARLIEHIDDLRVELDAASIELRGWHESAIYHRREDGGWNVGLRDSAFVGELIRQREREG